MPRAGLPPRNVCPYCDRRSVTRRGWVDDGYDGRGFACTCCGRYLAFRQTRYYTSGDRAEQKTRVAERQRSYYLEHRDELNEYRRRLYHAKAERELLRIRRRRLNDPDFAERRREADRRYREKKRRERDAELARAFSTLSRHEYKPKERNRKMNEHKPMRSIDLSALQGIFFEELDNLMSLDTDASDEEVEREINRAKAVSNIGGRAIENANTVCGILRARADLGGSKLSAVPKMLE